MTADIKLSPAKPYEGVAQWQAIRGAIKKLVGANAMSHFGGSEPRVSVSPREHLSVRVPGYQRGYAKVAGINVYPSRYGTQTDKQKIETATATFERVCTALSEAGWTVDRVTTIDRFAFIYGPGLTEWMIAAAKEDEKNNRRDKEIEAQNIADAKEMNALLKERGLPGTANHYGTPSVKLYLKDLKKLLGGEP